MTLKKGDKAPSFKLVNSDKKEVTLEQFAGKNLIIHFFPAAFTGVCTTQLCTVRDAISLYSNDKANVVAISVDLPFTLAKFKEEQKLNFDLLSDFNKEASRAYGAIYEDWILGLKGVAKRAAFVVDGSGTIQYAEVLENAGELPNFQAINDTLQALGVQAGA
ncbi:MAG: redoxin domain-containing protein [Bacteroidota bacterium]|jgi:peroxiredoxin|nr:redoxin domain-containing protein [Sphingobacteriales bacterium]